MSFTIRFITIAFIMLLAIQLQSVGQNIQIGQVAFISGNTEMTKDASIESIKYNLDLKKVGISYMTHNTNDAIGAKTYSIERIEYFGGKTIGVKVSAGLSYTYVVNPKENEKYIESMQGFGIPLEFSARIMQSYRGIEMGLFTIVGKPKLVGLRLSFVVGGS